MPQSISNNEDISLLMSLPFAQLGIRVSIGVWG